MDECPVDLSYTHRHIWVRTDEKKQTATVGMTQDLVEGLDEILSVDMPMVADELEMDVMCVHLHLPTRIFHVHAPLSGRVKEINREVLDDPGLLHVAPYVHWLYAMEYDEPEELDLLMSGSQYSRYLDRL